MSEGWQHGDQDDCRGCGRRVRFTSGLYWEHVIEQGGMTRHRPEPTTEKAPAVLFVDPPAAEGGKFMVIVNEGRRWVFEVDGAESAEAAEQAAMERVRSGRQGDGARVTLEARASQWKAD